VEGLEQDAVVIWTAADGRQIHLSGGPDQMREEVGLSQGVDGIGGLEPTAAFAQAAHQIGEDITQWTFAHGEIDLPLAVFGSSAGEVQARREWVKTMFSRDRAGWLCLWTPVTGWRWIRCRLRSMKPALSSSPLPGRRIDLDLVLLAEDPRSEEKPASSQWRNAGGSSHGSLTLWSGPEWVSWPTFVVSGPGSVELSMEGSTIRLPALEVGERCLLQSDPAWGVLRSVAADGSSRNRWPDVVGYLANPIPADSVSHIGIRVVSGGSSETAVLGQSRIHREGLM
jgi:hypothetical protein